MGQSAKKRQSPEQKEVFLDILRTTAPRGARVYSLTTGRTRSGSARYVRLFVVDADRDLLEITARVGVVAGCRVTNRGLFVPGWNFNAGAEVVVNLSRALHGSQSALIHEDLGS